MYTLLLWNPWHPFLLQWPKKSWLVGLPKSGCLVMHSNSSLLKPYRHHHRFPLYHFQTVCTIFWHTAPSMCSHCTLLSVGGKSRKGEFFSPPHVHIDFVVPPSGCGRSVTDFWGWGAHRAQLRFPGDVSDDDIYERGEPEGALNLNSTGYPEHGRYGDLSL
jgi:hypothetical protein